MDHKTEMHIDILTKKCSSLLSAYNQLKSLYLQSIWEYSGLLSSVETLLKDENEKTRKTIN